MVAKLGDAVLHTAYYNSPIGMIQLVQENNLLTVAQFLDETISLPPDSSKLLNEVLHQLNEYFSGIRTEFNLPLHAKGTIFQQKVWEKLVEIPFGKTITYLQLAKRLNNVKCIRAAASANGKNPLAVIIPCHRVIGANGKLTGYAGGQHRKQWLLEHEAKINGNPLLFS